MKNYFEFDKNRTNFRTEIIAGVTTFLSTMYIIVVNPTIISNAGMPFSGVLTATVLVSAFSSIAMGIFARNPIVVAPGMGLNAFFTFSVVLGMKVEWTVALGAVFWSGIIFILLSVLNIRTLILKAIPAQLRFAIAGGIGLFITLIGFVNAGFVVSDPATVISRGELNAQTLTFLAGLLFTAILVVKRMKGALITGITGTTVAACAVGRLWGEEQIVVWKGLFAAPDFSVIFQLDLMASLKLAMLPVVFAFLFTDMFDSLSTFVGIAEAGDIKDEDGEPRNIKQSLIVDGLATTVAGLFGSSPGTSYIESAAGIEIEWRDGNEVLFCGGRRTAVEGIEGLYPAFDITPSKYVTAIITEKGIIRPPFRTGIKKVF